MARVSSRLSQIISIISLAVILETRAAEISSNTFTPSFNSAKVTQVDKSPHNEANKRVEFEVEGRNIFKNLQIKATAVASERNSICSEDLTLHVFNISEKWTHEFTKASYVLEVPKTVHGKMYFCLPAPSDSDAKPNMFRTEPVKWLNQGPNVSLDLGPTEKENAENDILNLNDDETNNQRSRRTEVPVNIKVIGLRLEKAPKEPFVDENGIPEILAGANHTIRLFGFNFVKDMVVTFTPDTGNYGDTCQLPIVKGFSVNFDNSETVSVIVKLPAFVNEASAYYICIKPSNTTNITFVHQGAFNTLQIKTYVKMIPLWAAILIIILCLAFSSLFSGLNLGLMSLDMTELKILCNTGTKKEQEYAKAITPVRNHGNYLLCSILLGNVFVNSIFTILLDDLTSGLIAVIFSTLAIVMIGEITPQAVCSRHGLAIGAKTIYMTKIVMLMTFPLSYPIAKCLDYMLGEEIGNVYNRERLKELVKVTTGENDLDRDEVNIISGALELRKKTVAEVMTKIEDVFMLDYESILDFETVSEIMKSGYSRVPVYESSRVNIVTMLYIKDLAFLDPDDNTPLKTLCQFYQNPCNFVFEDVTLDVMFKIFKEGNKGHMAFVHRVNNEGEGDPFYETIGLITLEDVIEELIQAEIMDETDVFTDNRTKRRRIVNDRTKQDFTIFAERRGESKIRISPQLTLAAYQYLSTSVEQFHPNVISETILTRLLKQDIACIIKKNKQWRTDPACVIYQQGKSVDYFVLILEGRVEVTVGRENLTFEGGPFTYFGTQALVQQIGVVESPAQNPQSAMGSLESLNLDALLRHTFSPDYTVRACSEVLYLHIKRSLYLAAKRATLMERSQKDNQQTGEQFDEEVDKLLHDDGSIGRQTPRKRSRNNPPHESSEGHLSQSTSPKSLGPSIFSGGGLTNNQKDINGAIRSLHQELELDGKREEEVLLLPKKS